MTKHEQHRKNFAIGISVLTTALTLISLSASYATYLEFFSDWGAFGKVLAFGTTAGVELAFAFLIYGATYALIGAEFWLAILGALTLLAVMAINFNVHSAHVKGYSLAQWQIQWETWIGAVIPFYSIALLVFIGMTLYERRQRRQERRIKYLSQERALGFKEDYLNSAELEAELEPMKPAIAAEVKRQLQLPTMASTPRSPGFATRLSERGEDEAPK